MELFHCDDLKAIALMGSSAQGEAGIFSDIDLVRFREVSYPEISAETHFEAAMFVVANDVTPFPVEAWLSFI